MTIKKDTNKVIESLVSRGWEYIGRTGSGHHKLRYKNKQMIVGYSISDHRAIKNIKTLARRIERESKQYA